MRTGGAVLAVSPDDALAESLRAAGVDGEVRVAAGAEAALAALSAGGVDCVVVSSDCPDPLAVVERVRNAAAAVPVVVVTGGSPAVGESLSAGASDVVWSSDPPELLARRVEGATTAAEPGDATVLSGLQDTTRRLMAATDHDAVAETAAEAVRTVLDRPASGVLSYDAAADALVPLYWSPGAADILDETRTYGDGHPAIWSAYRDERPCYVPDCRDLDVDGYPTEGVDARSAMVYPLGEHGLLVVASTAPDDFEVSDRRFASILATAVESAFDRLEREAALAGLNEVATDLGTAESPDAVYDATVDAAERLLDFDSCVFRVERDGLLETVATSDPAVAPRDRMPADSGLAGRSYGDGESLVVDDMRTHPDAQAPDDLAAGLSVPVGDHGVFQAGHERAGHFDGTDRELAEVLASHAAAALSRLDSERRRREERQQFEKLFDVTPAPVVHARFDHERPVVRNVNAAFEETFGVDGEAVVGEPVNDVVAPAANHRSAQRISERVQDGESVEREVARTTVDGERQFILRVEPLGVGDTTEAIATYVDVTERSEREQLLAALHEVATDIDECRTMLAVCERTVEAAEELLHFDYCGISLAEDGILVPTVTSDDMPPSWLGPRSPQDGLVGTVYDEQAARLVTDVDADPDTDPRGPFNSAIVVPLGEHGVFSAVSHDHDAFDETDLELAELLADHAREALDDLAWADDLAVERERFEGLLDLVDQPVVHCRDAIDGPVVIGVNDAFEATFGFDAEAIAGRSLDEFIVPEDRREEADRLHDAVRDGERVERRVTRRTVGGEREFEVRLVPLDGVSETVAGYVPVGGGDADSVPADDGGDPGTTPADGSGSDDGADALK